MRRSVQLAGDRLDSSSKRVLGHWEERLCPAFRGGRFVFREKSREKGVFVRTGKDVGRPSRACHDEARFEMQDGRNEARGKVLEEISANCA
jgi:hypothetical protein